MGFVKIKTPRNVEYIINKIEQSGYRAYIVGGCVRDSILERIPEDWDITTSAPPYKIREIFPKTYDTGIKHGTVTVVKDKERYEVTTFRIEGKYEDFRRPSEVVFTREIIDDLKRRDFTINSIAYNDKDGLVDPFNGLGDLERRIIRCVGNPFERFNEDALRMLRAVRFSAQLDFEIEESTLDAIGKNASLIRSVSSERVRDEISKTLMSENPVKLTVLKDTRLLGYLLPEFERCLDTVQINPYHIYNVGIHSLKSVEMIEKDIVLRWAMLLHDTGKPLCKTTDEKGIDHFYGHDLKSTFLADAILKRLKFDNKTSERIIRLIRWHDRQIEPAFKAVRRAVRQIGDDIFMDLLAVKSADIKAQNPDFADERIKKLGRVKAIYEEIKSLNQCTSKDKLAVNGSDLIASGVKEGKQVGVMLEKLLDIVIENPEMNDRKKLLDLLKEKY